MEMNNMYYLHNEVTDMEVKNAMKNTFIKLMQIQQTGQMRWHGTVADLVELVHMMWYDGLTIDEHGTLLNFTDTVRRLCHRFNLRTPGNITSVMHNVKTRKNTDRMLIRRCARLMEMGERWPLERLVSIIS